MLTPLLERLAETAEVRAHIANQQIWDLHRGEVTTAVELRPVRHLVLGVHHTPDDGAGPTEDGPSLLGKGRGHPVTGVRGVVDEVSRRRPQCQ